jgi:hypothetical protein
MTKTKIKVVAKKMWVHPDTGWTASLTGACPGEGWIVSTHGFTCEITYPDGTVTRGLAAESLPTMSWIEATVYFKGLAEAKGWTFV